MKIHYDPAADALYLRLDESRIVESEEVRPGVVLDYDKDDQVVGHAETPFSWNERRQRSVEGTVRGIRLSRRK